jgi:hypothetical protein
MFLRPPGAGLLEGQFNNTKSRAVKIAHTSGEIIGEPINVTLDDISPA